MDGLERILENFEDYPEMDWEPVELPENGGDVV